LGGIRIPNNNTFAAICMSKSAEGQQMIIAQKLALAKKVYFELYAGEAVYFVGTIGGL